MGPLRAYVRNLAMATGSARQSRWTVPHSRESVEKMARHRLETAQRVQAASDEPWSETTKWPMMATISGGR